MRQRFKKLLAIMLTASLCIPAVPGNTAQAASASATFSEAENISVNHTGTERKNLFNSDWKFFLGSSSSAQNPDFNDADWRSVDLPHDFSIEQNFTSSGEAESGFLPGGTGWYRKSFTLPEELAGKSLVLNFDGVYNNAYIYVNGTQVGEHHYGYTSFSFDISDYVTCDGSTQNVIAVKVVHNLPSSRWYSGSGIYRDVNLIVTDPVHVALDGTTVTTPDIESGDGTVNVKVEVTNDSDAKADVTVRNTVYTSDDQKASEASETTVSVDAASSAEVSSEAVVAAPKLWSIDDPNLYYVRTELLIGGKVVDTYDSTFGFRWFKFDSDTGFSLNGENVKLNGVCMHHDQGALGSAAYYDAMYRQLSVMKEMGVNAIRITHNPQDQQYLEICNKLGLLAIEEFFDGWNAAKNGNTNDFSTYFTAQIGEDNQLLGAEDSMTWAEFAVRSTIRRDRNNPSLIMWSLGNEIQEGAYAHPQFPAIAQNLVTWMKDEDATRPATIGDNTRGGNATLNSVMQTIANSGGIIGFNYANSSQLASLHNTYSLICSSETSSAVNSRGIYNSQANRGNADGKYHLTSYDTSTVGWGKTACDSMWTTLTADYVAGEFVWTGFDYIGEPTPWNGTGVGDSGRGAIPNSSYFGIVETTGFPKDTYYLYRSQWKQDDTTLHLVTAWDSNNMINNNGKTPVWVYSNAPIVKLYRNDDLVGTATRKVNTTAAGHSYYTYTVESNNTALCSASNGSNATSLYSVFDVVYEDGTISAKAFDEDGNEIEVASGTTSVSTPDGVSKLIVSQDKTEIDADGSSLAYITVDVTDADGSLNTKADNTINFTLEGNGEILGVDNGDQATTAKYQQSSVLKSTTSANIKAYAGKALVIVKSTKDAGSFTLTASSDGMSSESVTVQTKATAASTQNGIASYRMSKHCYIPTGADSLPLPSALEATYTDGTTKSLPVSWDAYDKNALKTSGAFKINGTLNDGSETISVTMNIHVYDEIVSAKNYSGITAPNTMPTLPKASMTYYANGTAFEEYPVTWNLDGITADSFAKIGDIVTISGNVEALGKTYPVTASIRVAAPEYGDKANIAPDYLALSESCTSPSDNLKAITDGVRFDDNSQGTNYRWTNWNTMDQAANPEITMTWATAHLVDQINLYYYTDTNSKSQYPTSIEFQYSLDGTHYTTVAHRDPVKIDDVTSGTWTENVAKGYSFKLAETINPIAIRIILGHDPGYFVGLTEVEVISTTVSYSSNTSADLKGITIGGETINFGEADSYESNAASFDGLTVANDVNASVTIIPVNNREIRLISVAEDGKETRTYTVTLKNVPIIDPATEQQRTQLTASVNEAKSIDSKLYTADSYAKLQSIIKEIEANIATATKEQMTDYAARLAAAKAALVKISVTPVPDPTPVLKKGDTTEKGNIQYKVINASKKTAAVVKGLNKKQTKVTIPATVKINGVTCKVTQIGKNAFKGYSKLKTLTIGKNVTTIGANSFNGCKKLSKVTFKGTAVKTIKSGAFKKTSSKITVSVPKSLKKNTKKANAFKKKLIKSGMSKKLKLK